VIKKSYVFKMVLNYVFKVPLVHKIIEDNCWYQGEITLNK